MRRIYLDNAATGFPKPPAVAQAVFRYMTDCGSSIGRGAYRDAYSAEEMVYETRELLTELFHAEAPDTVIFTKNITESLNVLLKGLLKAGDHVLTSSMEHHAVMRPLTQLAETGVTFTRFACGPDGLPDTEHLEEVLLPLVTKRTRALVMTHASNVCGSILPVVKVGAFCRKHGLLFLLDSAQSAGLLPINMQEMNIDALAFTGHKSLQGPQGIGGFLIRRALAGQITPLLSGGTGSFSHLETVPELLPDRFEAGTPNLPGIAGLHAALLWLRQTGCETILAHERALTGRFLEGLRPLIAQGLLRVAGPADPQRQTGVVSVVPAREDPAEIAAALDTQYGIQTRVGLHCAPSAHRTLGTFPAGTIRFSFGWFNTPEDTDAALQALRQLLTNQNTERGGTHGF